MVLKPFDYSPEFIDVDLHQTNQNLSLKKKKKLSSLPDLAYATKLAEFLKNSLSLNFDACHSLGDNIDPDFLFSGEGSWMDPGEEIVLDEELLESLPPFVEF